jgi:hypothetical protein
LGGTKINSNNNIRNRALAGFVLSFAIVFPSVAALTVPPAATMSLPGASTLNLACTDLNDQGNFFVNSAQVAAADSVTIAASGLLDGGSGTITLGGDWTNNGTFNAGTGTVVISDVCGPGGSILSGNTVFNNLTLTGTTGPVFMIPSGMHVTVNGTLTLQGTAGTPIQLVSSSPATAFIILGPTASVVRSNANVSPLVIIGKAGTGLAPIPTLDRWALVALVLLLMFLSRPRTRAASQGESDHVEEK